MIGSSLFNIDFYEVHVCVLAEETQLRNFGVASI